MRPVHIAGFGQLANVAQNDHQDEAELVQAATRLALEDAGVDRGDVGFVCSGSCDYVMGRPFSFVMALDGVGAWPPIRESHVEGDGAFALYEAWVRLQHGDVDTALVYAYGKSSLGAVDDVLTLQLDPYVQAPLWPSPMALAALQARAMLDSGRWTERDFARVVARNLANARANPKALLSGEVDVDTLLAAPYIASPLRAHDGPARTDGAAAIVLQVGGGGPRIAGIDHKIDVHDIGARDLTRCPSAHLAAQRGGLRGVDVAELHAPYSSQDALLTAELGLSCEINPSGGATAADTPMVAGLIRIGEAARAIRRGANRALAHATSGPCLQQNLVCVLERS